MAVAKKKGRGRPHGTGLNDDPVLARMADLIVTEAALPPTTAAKRVLKAPGESTIRRLQAKWKVSGERHLAQARARRDAVSAPRPTSASSARTLRQIDMAERALRGPLDGTRLSALQEAVNNPTLRAIREAHDHPAMKAMREAHDSPVMRAMRELQDSPMMRAAREMEKVTRLIRGGF